MSKSTVLPILQELHPQKDWKVVRDGWGWVYHTADGWEARWVAVLAPEYPDDDDSFISRLYIYKPDKTAEFVIEKPFSWK